MYQITFSISTGFMDWFLEVEDKLKKDLSPYAIMVTNRHEKRLYIAVASENHYKKQVARALNDCLVSIYSKEAKRYYYKENLSLPLLSAEKYNILLAALTEFDSLMDKEYIKEYITIENGFKIDGIYNFKLSQLKSRWKDIGELTRDNAMFLSDNEIFFELIKYLFSAIAPKTEAVQLSFDGNKYTLLDLMRSEIISEVYSEEELFCSLIGAAPISLELKDNSIDQAVVNKLSVIFGLKSHSVSNKNYK